ncbi:MAG: S8 family serine peptidase [Bacteroidota bacterium]
MQKLSILTLIFGLFLFSAFIPSGDDDWRSKIDDPILEYFESSDEPIDFLVVLEKQADLSYAQQLRSKSEKGEWVFKQLQQTAQESQVDLLRWLNQEHLDFQSFYLINAIRVVGDWDVVRSIAQRTEIAGLHVNPSIRMEKPQRWSTEDLKVLEWGISRINADDVWQLGFRGQGAVVGGQDTGYQWDHPALINTYRGWDGSTANHDYNWHDAIHEINPLHNDPTDDPSNNPCGLDAVAPCDDNGHGTHTMGTMVGEDNDSQIGVAPDADWICCRNMERGWGQPSTYIECFEWFLAPTDVAGNNPDPLKAPDVIANSWSCPEVEGCFPSNFADMELAVNNLTAAGVFVVVSAGNSGGNGCSTISTPAAIFENSFTVGALRSDDTLAAFSSRGLVTIDGSNRLKPNVSAPGRFVRSSYLNDGYATLSGTSMAGPHVAGVVALMISADTSLAGDISRIKQILESTTYPAYSVDTCGNIVPTVLPNPNVGYGGVDALAAVQEVLNSTSIISLLADAIRVFPNPNAGVFNLEVKGISGEGILEVFDLQGRQVLSLQRNWTNGEQQVIHVTEVPNGVYVYRFSHEKGSTQGKLMVSQ